MIDNTTRKPVANGRRRQWLRCAGAGIAGLVPTIAWRHAAAQVWPSKPIKIIVPFAAGGSLDIVSRALGERVGAHLGVTMLVDNRPGAAGVIGYEAGAGAAPDGYTLICASDTLTLLPHLDRKLRFDPLKDFVPISQLTSQPLVVTTHASLNVNSIKALIALAKKRPGEIG